MSLRLRKEEFVRTLNAAWNPPPPIMEMTQRQHAKPHPWEEQGISFEEWMEARAIELDDRSPIRREELSDEEAWELQYNSFILVDAQQIMRFAPREVCDDHHILVDENGQLKTQFTASRRSKSGRLIFPVPYTKTQLEKFVAAVLQYYNFPFDPARHAIFASGNVSTVGLLARWIESDLHR